MERYRGFRIKGRSNLLSWDLLNVDNVVNLKCVVGTYIQRFENHAKEPIRKKTSVENKICSRQTSLLAQYNCSIIVLVNMEKTY